MQERLEALVIAGLAVCERAPLRLRAVDSIGLCHFMRQGILQCDARVVQQARRRFVPDIRHGLAVDPVLIGWCLRIFRLKFRPGVGDCLIEYFRPVLRVAACLGSARDQILQSSRRHFEPGLNDLYSLFYEAHTTGHPIMRPLVYHFPDDPRCWTESFDFMLGSHLLVASMLEPGVRTRKVYLPAGTWWCDFHTSQWYEGGQEIEVAAPLEQIPLLVRDGGIIPMLNEGRLTVQVYSRGDAEFTLFEDDGISRAYTQGAYTTIRLSFTRSEDESWAGKAERTHAGYALPYEAITFINVGDLPSEGMFNVDRYRKIVAIS